MEMSWCSLVVFFVVLLALVSFGGTTDSDTTSPRSTSDVVCYLPPSIAGTAYIPKGIKANYTEGQVVVHFCSLTVGYGTVVQRCQHDGGWSAPSRDCNDVPPIGGGTAVGFSFAILNGWFVVTVLVRNYFLSSSSYTDEANFQEADRPV